MAVVPVPALAILVLMPHAVSSHGKPGLGGCGADPKSVVVHGAARFTVLSSHAIEIESPPFDDRCTFNLVNRASAVAAAAQFTSTVRDGQLTISTAAVVLTFNPTGGPSPAPAPLAPPVCPAWIQNNTDIPGGSGARAGPAVHDVTLSQCCSQCEKDPVCAFFIFGEDYGPMPRPVNGTRPNCWLMHGSGPKNRTIPTEGRLVGWMRAPSPPGPPPPPPPTGPFTAKTLSITVKASGLTWHPGDANLGNLQGTISSWNEIGPAVLTDGLQPGVLSRDGWALFDETATPRYSNRSTDAFMGVAPFVDGSSLANAHPGVPGASARNGADSMLHSRADWIFMGCGANFRGCLADYASFAGAIPLPPKAAFGIWWSHYEPYSAESIQTEVLAGFDNYSLPLNVLEMDVNWHFNTDSRSRGCQGFNGYDWNTTLFPDPVGYVATVRAGNWSRAVSPAPATPLKLILNSHNMLGVDSCQAEYLAVAKDAGVGTGQNGTTTVPWNTTDLKIMESVFKHLLARDAEGTRTSGTRPDWWWTDGALTRWSTEHGCGLGRDVDNLFMDTYLHSSAIRFGTDTANNRPLVMPRYALPGQHRYCCGFSGDTDSVWLTLQAEVNMTKTAANILFGYWSHDVGGFRGDPGPELYARWAQFAAVSPLWRSHGSRTGSPRRYWQFTSFAQIKEAMELRVVLTPLLYTLGAAATRTAVAAVHPVYYDHPLLPEAYEDPFQFMVGDDMLVRPVVTPIQTNGSGGTVPVVVWLPPTTGGWVEWNSSRLVPARVPSVTVDAGLADLPVFVKSGAVLPLLPRTARDVTNTSVTVWAVFGGAASGAGSRYWDDGVTTKYEEEVHGVQNFTFTYSSASGLNGVAGGATLTCNIASTTADNGYVPPTGEHTHFIELRGFMAGTPAKVEFNGVPGSIEVVARHSLARPRGTVLLSSPGPVTLGTAVTVVVTF